jgi:ADP-heptose:LPS heptosyltransferase
LRRVAARITVDRLPFFTFLTGEGTFIAKRTETLNGLSQAMLVLDSDSSTGGRGVLCGRRRIAILRALELGDVLCAVPAMRAIRRAAPMAAIDFIGLPWARSFVSRFSHLVDGFVEFPGYPGLPERDFDAVRFDAFLGQVRSRRYDLVIQMHGSGGIVNDLCRKFGARHVSGYYPLDAACPDPRFFMTYPEEGQESDRHVALAGFLGASIIDDRTEFPIRREDEQELEDALDGHEIVSRRYVCLHPGARYLSRRWPTDRFAAIGDRLADTGFQVIVTGSAEEIDLAHSLAESMRRPCLVLAGRTSLGAAAYLVSRAALVVTNDTGMSHIADAVRTPSVVVVLGSDAARWAPRDRSLHAVVTHRVACQPCTHRNCPIDFPCAEGLTVERVLSACMDMLLRSAASHRHPVLQASSPSASVSAVR